VSATTPRRTVDVIDRRVGVLFGVFVLLLVFAVARAGYLGLFRGSALRQAANDQQVQTTPIPAVRGEITDRDGTVLALSEPADEIDVDPRVLVKTYKQPQVVADKLAPLVGLSRSRTLALITKPGSQYEQLSAQVPATTATKIMALKVNGIAGVNGIWDVPTEHRAYPRGTEAGQLIGWVGSNGKGDGLEYTFNHQLAGVSGSRHSVIDAQGRAISVQTAKAMVPGKNLQLTISAPLQAEVEQVLAGVGRQYEPQGATAIVTDPQTDQILALANWPSVNPNHVPASAWTPTGGQVPAAEDQAVDMSYEPGSTFKAITVAGALQDGLVTPSTDFDVPPYLEAYGKRINDAEPHGYETLSVSDILKVSSNIGAVLIGKRLGPTRFGSWVNRFGFGKATGVSLPGEQTGLVRPVGGYSGLSMFNLPFGQGESVTPMQMIQAYDAIADGGVLRTPQIVDSIGGKTKAEPKGKRIISANVASELRGMLRGVLADGGTASGAAIPGYDMAGKTGTAQVVVDGKYSSTDYMASFIGMVPASDPKLVVAVVVNDPKGVIYGGSVAAPAFQRIVGWAVPHFGINPCPSPCPASAFQSATPSTP
jgi:cell division protein FtsI (penicillin-binding protein 3)